MKNRNVEYMRIPSPFFLTLALKDPRAMFFVPQLEKVSLVIPNNTVLEVLYKSDKSEYPVPKSWSAQGERTPAGAGWGPLPKTPRTGKTRRTTKIASRGDRAREHTRKIRKTGNRLRAITGVRTTTTTRQLQKNC